MCVWDIDFNDETMFLESGSQKLLQKKLGI